jgi:hypothetical protein
MEPLRLTMEPWRLIQESHHFDKNPDPHKKNRIRIRMKVQYRSQIRLQRKAGSGSASMCCESESDNYKKIIKKVLYINPELHCN